VELEGAFVRDDGPRVAQGQPRGHDVLIRARGEMPQSVEPATDPSVAAAGPGMMAQRAAIHPCGDRLRRGEVPRLRLCLSIETIVIYVRQALLREADLPRRQPRGAARRRRSDLVAAAHRVARLRAGAGLRPLPAARRRDPAAGGPACPAPRPRPGGLRRDDRRVAGPLRGIVGPPAAGPLRGPGGGEIRRALDALHRNLGRATSELAAGRSREMSQPLVAVVRSSA
jgi:hypothetical protein